MPYWSWRSMWSCCWITAHADQLPDAWTWLHPYRHCLHKPLTWHAPRGHKMEKKDVKVHSYQNGASASNSTSKDTECQQKTILSLPSWPGSCFYLNFQSKNEHRDDQSPFYYSAVNKSTWKVLLGRASILILWAELALVLRKGYVHWHLGYHKHLEDCN